MNENDLFAAGAKIKPDLGRYRSIYTFDLQDVAIGAFAKWVVLNAFKIDGVWRAAKGNKTELCVEAKARDVPYLRHFVGVIHESFHRLWAKYRSGSGAELGDEHAFYQGLYDGLMRDARAAGQSIPKWQPARRRGKRGKRPKPVSAASDKNAGLHLHAYEIACGLGEQIRMSHPLEQVSVFLEDILREAAAKGS